MLNQAINFVREYRGITGLLAKEGIAIGGIVLDKDMVLDLIYPKRCPFCKEVIPFQKGQVCGNCLKKLKKVEAPGCMKCGKTLEQEEEEYCRDCDRFPKSYKRGFPVFFYEEPLKSALYGFKYKNQRDYAVFFADCIRVRYGGQIKKLGIDGIVPVPVHPKRKRKRGYNQAEVLALRLGKRLGIPVYPFYLLRIVDTDPQKGLSDKGRTENLKNAFKIGQNKIKLKKVLLVDDIYTSGATVEACTKVLLSAGAEEIYYTSVAIGKGYSG